MKKLPFKFSIQANSDSEEPAEISIRGVIGETFDPMTWTMKTTEEEVLSELAQIPKGKKIRALINSPGGDFGLALGCYNALASRYEDVTTVNCGYACSAASVLMCAGKNRISPVSCNWMIHCGSTEFAGNADDAQKALNALNSIDKTMAAVYCKASGVGTPEEWLAKMQAETWFTGTEACDAKLGTSADGETDSPDIEMTAEAKKVFATFRKIPTNLQPRFSAVAQAATPPPTNTPQPKNISMKKVIAALVALGFPTAEDAGEEIVAATVTTAVGGLKTERDGYKTKIEALAAARKTRITAAVDSAVTDKIITDAEKADLILVGSASPEGESVIMRQISDARESKAGRPGRGVNPVPRGASTGEQDSIESLLEEQKEAVASGDGEKVAAVVAKLRAARGRKEPLFNTEPEYTRARN